MAQRRALTLNCPLLPYPQLHLHLTCYPCTRVRLVPQALHVIVVGGHQKVQKQTLGLSCPLRYLRPFLSATLELALGW